MKGENKLVGIDKNWLVDAGIGIGIAIAVFVLSKILGIVAVIGVPSFAESITGDIGQFLIIVVAASIFETILFQEFILDFLDRKVKNLPFILAAIGSSVLFAVFHLTAYTNFYGSIGSAMGGFITVFMWGMIFCYIRKYTNSIMAVITAHATLNFIIEFVINKGWIIFN